MTPVGCGPRAARGARSGSAGEQQLKEVDARQQYALARRRQLEWLIAVVLPAHPDQARIAELALEVDAHLERLAVVRDLRDEQAHPGELHALPALETRTWAAQHALDRARQEAVLRAHEQRVLVQALDEQVAHPRG